MENNLIEICNEKIFYKNIIYKFSLDNLRKIKLGKKRKVVILGEDLYTKKIKLNRKVKVKEEEIQNVIERAFGSSEDFLFHYEFSRRKGELIIYAVKGGMKIRELCQGAASITVEPIQMCFFKKFKKNVREKNWETLFSYKGNYYYISCDNNFIARSFVDTSLSRFIEKYLEVEREKNLKTYIEEGISKEFPESYNTFVIKDFGEVLNAKKVYK